jgi:hypothetical protein
LNSGIQSSTSPPPDEDITHADSELIWGFNNFAATAKITRHNIHAVVYECSSITNEIPIEHNIQFSVEDFSMLTGESSANNVPEQQERVYRDDHLFVAAAAAGVNGVSSAGASPYDEDLMNALQDLDDFFNEDGEHIPNSPLGEPRELDQSGSFLSSPSPSIPQSVRDP